MGTKRDYMYMLLLLLVVVLGSCITEDSRLITPKEESKFEEVAHKATLKAKNVQFLCKPDLIQAEIGEAPEVVEEVEVESLSVENSLFVSDIESEPVIEEYYDPGLIYLGEYQITAYEYTGNPCANGNWPTEWYTVASNYFDFGTMLYIDGIGYVVVEDRGASWHSDNWLDIYLGDESACYDWGVKYLDVYLVG